MHEAPLTIVGAGVVGLALAAALAPRYPGLVVLERRRAPGSETSSRNSEVIHAGIYYPAGSLKANLCIRGATLLYQLCHDGDIPHRRVGKLVVASSAAEEAELDRLLALGRANGAELIPLTGAQCRALEPAVAAHAGLLSPNTGILDSQVLLGVLARRARAAGAQLLTSAALRGVERRGGNYLLTVSSPAAVGERGDERGRREGDPARGEVLRSPWVINAAGLEADTIAQMAGIDIAAAGYRLHWCKGSYFAAIGAAARLTSRLIYPVPTPISLGVHAVPTMDGRLRFGPDAEYLAERALDYRVAEERRSAFGAAIRRLLPTVRDEQLHPDLAGIRPKRQGPGDGFSDFVIAEESARGLPGFINVLGIESPGLTAALAIAERVAQLLTE